MYLHLGSGIAVRTRDIILILDSALLADEKIKAALIKDKRGQRLPVTKCLPRGESDEEISSLIVTKGRLYLSPISAVTLKKRSEEKY